MQVPQLFKWSPTRAPPQQLDDSPNTHSPSRFSALHHNVRSIINGSSIYSQSPNPNGHSSTTTPKPPFRALFHRDGPSSPPDPVYDEAPVQASQLQSPFQAPHRASAYTRAILGLRDPREPEVAYYSEDPFSDRHSVDVALNNSGSLDQETEELRNEVNQRRRKKRRHRRGNHHHHGQYHGQRPNCWVRRRKSRGKCMSFINGGTRRGKLWACIISGTLLAAVLATYLTLALTRKTLGQEIHVVFIMVTLGITIFFCHSLIRLCILILHPRSASGERAYMPSTTDLEGFKPIRPIRVHLTRDEHLSDEERAIEGAGQAREATTGTEDLDEKVTPPPPAYGLWRSSVRVNPNLLHWQRVEQPEPSPANTAPTIPPLPFEDEEEHSRVVSARTGAARPPSYVSEDGVSYVMGAAPRSVVASHSGVSDIHPAWRPGYAMSEVEWPGRRR